MIKVFTLNKNGKIELTKEELEQLLNESYWDGFNKKSWIYASPSWTYKSPTTSPLDYGKFTISTTNNTKTLLNETYLNGYKEGAQNPAEIIDTDIIDTDIANSITLENIKNGKGLEKI